MKDTKTYCFGRFLIDLPKTAEVNGQAYEYMFGKIESERFLKGEAGFAQKMKEREQELRAGQDQDDFSLVETRSGSSPNTKIFKLSLQLFKNVTYGFEAHRWTKNGVMFSTRETAFSQDKIDSVLQRLETRLLPNLSYRSPDKIPTEPGFCIENGFIADDGKTEQYEYAKLFFKFKNWPDVTAEVIATRGGKIQPSLLDRVNSKPIPEAFAEAAKEIKTFREGKHDVGPLKGEEILEALPTDHGFFIHRFVWDTQGKLNSATEPAFYFELQTGVAGAQDVRPSLTDKQAIELFDAIVNSIRMRPTIPGKTSAAEPNPNDESGATNRLPLGTKVSSLRACPESGIYECSPDAPGVAKHRVFVAQGRPMPSASIIAPKRGVAGILGAQEQKEVETTWTLVAYEQ